MSDMLSEAEKLPDETIAAAQVAVANNDELREWMDASGYGNNAAIIRQFARNPHATVEENLAAASPVAAQAWAARGMLEGPAKVKADPTKQQSIGSYLLKGTK